MGLRFLVIESNTREDRERHAAACGLMPSQSYGAVLGAIEAGAICDLAWSHGVDAQVLDPVLQTTEIRNFVENRVKSDANGSGRARA